MASRDMKNIRQSEMMPMPFAFLSLAPATSTNAAKEEAPRPMVRRSSSLSSESSQGSIKSPYRAPYRILKLAPVHLGEHADNHKADWHEVALE
jgi:hypothetical protein